MYFTNFARPSRGGWSPNGLPSAKLSAIGTNGGDGIGRISKLQLLCDRISGRMKSESSVGACKGIGEGSRSSHGFDSVRSHKRRNADLPAIVLRDSSKANIRSCVPPSSIDRPMAVDASASDIACSSSIVPMHSRTACRLSIGCGIEEGFEKL